MAIRYSVNYIETQSSGFSFFNRFRSQRKVRCDKCTFNHAVMQITNNDDPDNKVSLCVPCYNQYSIEELLEENLAKNKAK